MIFVLQMLDLLYVNFFVFSSDSDNDQDVQHKS